MPGMESRKDKLPKGRSYPLKPSVLEAAIADAGLELPISLTRWDYNKAEGFSATFYPEGSFPEGLRFWVSCGAAPSDRAAEIRDLLETQAIPQFIEWAKEIEGLDVKSPRRREPQRFCWEFPAPQS